MQKEHHSQKKNYTQCHLIKHNSLIISREETRQFVVLWTTLNEMIINPEPKDKVNWRWTSDGTYSTKSVYD
jgi:hypothetical protein